MGPVNNKEKPTGSGTTSDARRKRRLGKQWDALEKAGAAYKPDSEESMDTHIEQLGKGKRAKRTVEGYQPLSSRGLLPLSPPDPYGEGREEPWKRLRRRMPRRPESSGGMQRHPKKPWKRQERSLKPRRLLSLEKLKRPPRPR